MFSSSIMCSCNIIIFNSYIIMRGSNILCAVVTLICSVVKLLCAVQTALFISTLDTPTKFVIMTI